MKAVVDCLPAYASTAASKFPRPSSASPRYIGPKKSIERIVRAQAHRFQSYVGFRLFEMAEGILERGLACAKPFSKAREFGFSDCKTRIGEAPERLVGAARKRRGKSSSYNTAARYWGASTIVPVRSDRVFFASQSVSGFVQPIYLLVETGNVASPVRAPTSLGVDLERLLVLNRVRAASLLSFVSAVLQLEQGVTAAS